MERREPAWFQDAIPVMTYTPAEKCLAGAPNAALTRIERGMPNVSPLKQ